MVRLLDGDLVSGLILGWSGMIWRSCDEDYAVVALHDRARYGTKQVLDLLKSLVT